MELVWTYITRNVREEHCVTAALEWRPDGRKRSEHSKTTWRRTVEEERHGLGWQS